MKKLAIIHFSPIELFPPTMNWLFFLDGAAGEDTRIRVFTMRPGDVSRKLMPESGKIRIIRPVRAGAKGWKAWSNYVMYYIQTIIGLLLWRPDTVLYYETLSSLPALLYKRYLNRKAGLYIHYHEYTSPAEYEQGMRMSRTLHKLERNSYKLADWISHTNAQRIRLFRSDMGDTGLPDLYELPNYPPISWEPTGQRNLSAGPIKVVYVGALSLETMYIAEFAEWVTAQHGKVTWDIYSDNISDETRAYLLSLGVSTIRFREAVDYQALPQVLAAYDIGVILYKGHIPNYVYNAPNKLFEYLACGLDVWFPNVMEGIDPFVTSGTYPKVLSLDFTSLASLDLSAATARSGMSHRPSAYYAEKVLPGLLEQMRTIKH
ncbi:MAG TPA: hypothetical protein VGN00_23405 [Puia sp.]|jgi:hypothetical protein